MKNIKWNVVVMVSAIGLLLVAVYLLRQARRAEAIARENAAALQDSTHVYRDKADSTLAAYARLQLQTTDSFKHLSGALKTAKDSLKLVTKALTRLQVSFDSAVATSSHSTVTDGVRVATDTLAGPPVEGVITASAPLDTLRPMTLAYILRPSPFTVTSTLSCSPRGPVVAWETPSWVRVQVGLGAVDPAVCHPVIPLPGLSLFGWRVPWYVWLGAGMVAGWEVRQTLKD